MKRIVLSLLLLCATATFGQSISYEDVYELYKQKTPSQVSERLRTMGFQMSNTQKTGIIQTVTWKNSSTNNSIDVSFSDKNEPLQIIYNFHDSKILASLRTQIQNKGWSFERDEIKDNRIESVYLRDNFDYKISLSECAVDYAGVTSYSFCLSSYAMIRMDDIDDDNTAYSLLDSLDHFPTFNGNINTWLAANLKYPPVAAENGIEGSVMVQFIVRKDGSITDVTVIRGVDSSLDKEAIRVINSMPKWIPAKRNGSNVDSPFTLPVAFKLQ